MTSSWCIRVLLLAAMLKAATGEEGGLFGSSDGSIGYPGNSDAKHRPRSVSLGSDKGRSSSTEPTKSKLNQLNTHLPDQVVYRNHELPMPAQRTMQGVLMFLDISGFTSLCERFSMNAKNGTDKLTKTLNGYMGALVEEILSFDGDVLKYAGDAILTLWRVDNYVQMKPTVMQVISCALSIQEKYGVWTTSVGVKLKVKLGIAAGSLSIIFLGNDEFCHYVSMGRAVQAVNAAEHFCTSGDIVVSPTAWCHVSQLPIVKTVLDDKKHLLVTGLEEEPEAALKIMSEYETQRTIPHPGRNVVFDQGANKTQSQIKNAPSKGSGFESGKKNTLPMAPKMTIAEDHQKKPKEEKERNSSAQDASLSGDTLGINFGSDMEIAPPTDTRILRKAVIEKASREIQRKLRLYVAKPVLRKLDDHQSIEYLSEMRQVTIVFINLVTENVAKHYQLTLLQEVFAAIYASVKKMQGCLNKIFMFDKGCTFLVIFGLPGFKHENDCAHALQASYDILNKLNVMEHIERCSIGVTTGSTFCGVVGHEQRHEYTVIGRKVNMAARLMMHYPGIVSCDNETYHHSKLPKSSFVQQELKQMKGLRNVGTIREFTGSKGKQGLAQALKVEEFQYPLLGRETEMDEFRTELETIRKSPDKATQVQLVVFNGEPGIGKTRMLDGAINEAVDQGMRVMSCALTMHDNKLPYFVVRNLLVRLLDLDGDRTHQEREMKLFGMIKTPFIIENMCLLNDLLQLKIPMNEKYVHMDIETRTQLFHTLLFEIVHEMCIKYGFVVFAVDDAHFMDAESWEFVVDLGQDMRSLVVLTVRTSSIGGLQLCPSAKRALNMPTVKHITLGGLGLQYMSALACHLLDVVQIPLKLDTLLREKSHGVPSWCEQLLADMIYDNVLTIIHMKEKDAHLQGRRESSVAPDQSAIEPRQGLNSNTSDEKLLKSSSEPDNSGSFDGLLEGYGIRPKQDPNNKDMICIITPGQSLEVGMPDSIKGMIQTRIDRMEEVDQLVLKCASILGQSFSREMLDAIMPSRTMDNLNEAIQRLGEQNILECLWVPNKGVKKPSEMSGGGGSAKCHCGRNEDTERTLHLDCCSLRFTSSNFRETAYEMLVESARQALHVSAAEFLEHQAHKCEACGGGGFLVGLHKQKKEDDRRKVAKPHRTSLKPSNKVDVMERQPSFSEAVKKRNTGQRRGSVSLRIHQPSGGTSTPGPGDPILEEFGEETETVTETVTRQDSSSSATDADDLPEVEFDLRECLCMEILASVYPMLVRHWRAAGNVEKTIQFLMEAGSAAIAIYDNMQALSYLKEVERILEALKEKKNPFEGEQTTITDEYSLGKWEKARLESLTGQALYHLGQIEESLPHFHKSLEILGNPQPKTKLKIISRLMSEGWTQWNHLKFPRRYLGKTTSGLAHRLMEQTRCLSHVFHDYMSTYQVQQALLTALQQVNKAEEVNEDLDELIIAYTCMMECCLSKSWRGLALKYEEKGHKNCQAALGLMKPEHWLTVAHFYCTSLTMRFSWGFIREAVDAGYMAVKLIKRLHDNDLLLQILPSLAQALLAFNRIKSCVETLRDLKYTDDETTDVIGRTWYFNCCWDLLLEAGFRFETWSKCLDFAESVSHNSCFTTDQLPLFYLASNISLWQARRESWFQVESWLDRAAKNQPARLTSFMALHGSMKMFEARLITLSHIVFKQDKKKARVVLKTIGKELTSLKKACSTVLVLQPRLLHMRAYLAAIHGLWGKAEKLLASCRKKAQKMENMLEDSWAQNSQQVWFHPEHVAKADLWLTHVMSDDGMGLMDWNLADKVDSNQMKYSLPLPISFEK